MNFISGVGLGMLLTVILAENFHVFITSTRASVAECEAELPRHLQCEPVFSARVVEEE